MHPPLLPPTSTSTTVASCRANKCPSISTAFSPASPSAFIPIPSSLYLRLQHTLCPAALHRAWTAKNGHYQRSSNSHGPIGCIRRCGSAAALMSLQPHGLLPSRVHSSPRPSLVCTTTPKRLHSPRCATGTSCVEMATLQTLHSTALLCSSYMLSSPSSILL